jgi:protein-tyrosine phosphatase
LTCIRTIETPRKLGVLLLLTTALAAACAHRPAPVVPPSQDPVAVRQRDGSIWIRWQAAPEGRVRAYVGSDPDAILRTFAIGELANGTFVATGLPDGQRPYFELVPDSGPSIIVAERLLPLEGAQNFRDLGGYPTADGRRVRWGQIYRSDHLGDLSDADLDYLDGLGIHTICDFRSGTEREDSPDRFGESGSPPSVNPAIADERFAVDELKSRILTGDLEGIDFANVLVEGNQAFVRDYAMQYGQFFRLVEDPSSLPLVFHCTAGKDRAGWASAALLTALGVSEQDVVRDYLLSQLYTQHKIESTLRLIRWASLFRTDPEQIRPLMSVDPAYIGAAIEAAEEDHGSVDAYLAEALGMDSERRAALRDLLLR